MSDQKLKYDSTNEHFVRLIKCTRYIEVKNRLLSTRRVGIRDTSKGEDNYFVRLPTSVLDVRVRGECECLTRLIIRTLPVNDLY